jgi:hypothetical protein
MYEIKITNTSYLDVRQGKLVLVERRITEGYYNLPQVIDKVIGNIIDILV